MKLMPLIARKTASVFTHIQPGFDPGGLSFESSQALINSGRAGAVFEHQFKTLGEFLTHQGFVNLQEKLNHFKLPGIQEFERFVLCGGAMFLPAEFYVYPHPSTGQEVKPTEEFMGQCHYQAFVKLVWDIGDVLEEANPRELHFCVDTMYAAGRRIENNERFLYTWFPSYQKETLGRYQEFLRGMRIPYDVYFGGEKVLETANPKLALFVWRTVADFLEALPAEGA